MYKLIVCSVDDTLLTNNHTLSEDTKEALLQAQQAGARLALISRRSPQNLKKIAEKLQMNTYRVISPPVTEPFCRKWAVNAYCGRKRFR